MSKKDRRMGIFGKFTEELKMRIALDTQQILARRAQEAGMSVSEYCRTVLESHAHGRDEVIRLQQERLNRVLNGGDV